MSKRSKVQNAERKARRADDLLWATNQAVGTIFGTDAECYEAVALFRATASRLGYTTRAQPVHVIATYRQEGCVVTSEWAAHKAFDLGIIGAEDVNLAVAGNTTGVGHIVVLAKESSSLYDPTWRQFSRGNVFPDHTIAVEVGDIDDGSESWTASDDSLQVAYFAAEGYEGWAHEHELLLRKWSAVSQVVADAVLSGRSDFHIPAPAMPATTSNMNGF